MPQYNHKQDLSINPRGMIYLFLFVGLILLAYAIITGSMVIAVAIITLPIFLVICLYGMQYPIFSYILYCTVNLYFAAIYRYTEIENLSGILDVFLCICLFSIAINIAGGKRNEYYWKNAFNVLSIGELLWVVFTILELLAPYSYFPDIIKSRSFIFIIPISYLLSGILLDNYKKLRITILLLGIFVITVGMKLYWQKTQGWDWAETKFLMDYEAWHTHLLRDGVRYFSFFSDAGNFGAVMGVFFTTFGLISITLKNTWFRWLCIGVTLVAGTGLVMSGTRGAVIIPFAGLFLYLLLSKNAKAIAISTLAGIMTFCFFYFTDIGNDNSFIRRTRTAFRPTEDASYNVRVENRKRFAHYLREKPFGIGLGNHVVDTERLMILEEEYIPTDSFYVDIWVENGIIGLCIYLIFLGTIIMRCCYILFFKVHHQQLRKILIAMLAGIFGFWVNGYVGRAMGASPGSLLVPIFLSFVLNGPYIEKHMKSDYKF